MSYFRPGMGDGPVTDPCQVDPSTCPPPPAPTAGGATASTPTGGGPLAWLTGLIAPVLGTQPTGPAADQGMSDTTKMVLAGGAVLALYYLTRKKRA
jgi:hypothetical protein